MDRLAVKRRLGRLYSAIRLAERQRCVTLLYHAVGEGPWSTPPGQFDQQLRLLSRHADLVPLGVQCFGIGDGGSQARVSVSLTFDDGYACLFDNALPIVRNMGATATVFVNTSHLSETAREPSDSALGHYPGEEFLTWQETASLVEADWEIGSHGTRHDDLTLVSPEEANRQAKESKAAIEAKLMRSCTRFAYTWGRHTPRVREAVQGAGYREAFTGEHAPHRDSDDPFRLPRVNVARDYSLDDLRAIIQGDWDYLKWLGKARALIA